MSWSDLPTEGNKWHESNIESVFVIIKLKKQRPLVSSGTICATFHAKNFSTIADDVAVAAAGGGGGGLISN